MPYGKSVYSYEPYFPFGKIREQQRLAIEFALRAFFVDKKRFVIAEVGTGGGKSAIGITIARTLQAMFESSDPLVTLGGTYVLTTQKVLQEQYLSDFGNDKGLLKLIKSSSGYKCQFFDDRSEDISCGEIQRLLASKAKCGFVYQNCTHECRFKEAKVQFLNSPEGISNYAYHLTSATYTSEVQRRGLLILDEAHNIENALSSFVKISFSNFFYKSVLGVKTPPINASQETIYSWLVNTCQPRLRQVIKRTKQKVEKAFDSVDAIEGAKELELLSRSLKRIEYFQSTYNPKSWVLDVSKSDKRGERIYEFKPIDVAEYAHSMLFAHCDRTLILSATILDKNVFCDSIGIKPEDVAFIRIPSPFPPENRPVHYLPVGSMSKSCIEKTLPVMVEAVKMLLQQHSKDKGIIHCGTFRIAKYLYDHLNDPRLLVHDSTDRNEVIQRHVESTVPTVLLSPSMTEGVDLADDKSRFQILCKVPFPYLGDAAVKKRMDRNPQWYSYQAVKSIVQAMGRSIRNENDHAISYILDSDWSNFYKRNHTMFPEEFSAALQV